MDSSNILNHNKVQKYQNIIESYLNKYRVGHGHNIKYTHISMGENFTGKFLLDKKQIKQFYKLYAESINYGVIFNIAEKPQDYGPVIIDIDIEILKENYIDGTRLYNLELILTLINTYREVMNKYLDLESVELVASVFEKKMPTIKSTTIKDGIHIIFHAITVHYKLKYIFRYYVIDLLRNNDIFTGFTKSLEDIIDKAVINTNCWLLPGSKKKDGQLYELKNIYDDLNKPLDITQTLQNKYKLIKLYALYYRLRCKDNASVLLESITEDIIEYEYSNIHKKPTIIKQIIPIIGSENKEEEITKAQYLVSLLSKDRNESFDSWIRIGWALHNIDNSLLETWIDFSKQSDKFKENECEEKWYQMRNEGLSIRSLMYWAEEDNYYKYHEYIKKDFVNILNKSLDGSTYLVAKVLYNKYMDRFVCSSIKTNEWYEFKNHKWFIIHDGYSLKKEISESFVNEYSLLVVKYSKLSLTLDSLEKEQIHNKISQIQKLITKLMNINYKEKIMKEATILFFDPEFEKKLDENYDLICFNNGVYDLYNNEFRDGRPDDYISKSTNLNYSQFSKTNENASSMFKFFNEILPNEAVRNYLFLTLSTCVAGHNKEEKCCIITGSGSNGKSLLFSLVQQSLGDYYISCPITIITRKRNSSNSASPELLRLKGVRCGCFQETDDGEKLNVGILKEITGNDSFMVRGLYSDPIEIKPQVKFFLACNQLPEVPSIDGGTWRRLRVIDFKSKFTENPNPEKSNEFIIDNTLKQKIKYWAPIFISYLIEIYINEYKHLAFISEPDEVKYSTETYKAENDRFTEFFINRIKFTNKKSDSISIKTMYEEFKLWFKECHEGGKIPSQMELNKFLYEKIGQPINNKWKEYTLNNDSISSDDEEV